MNKRQLSERDICTKFFTPALKQAGWNIQTQILEEVYFTDGRIYVRGKRKFDDLKSFRVKGGDIIISRSGTVGELCILPADVPGGLISTNLMMIPLSRTTISPEYFCYQIKGNKNIQEDLYQLCSGSTRIFLTQTILKKLKFILPPLSEQHEIVRRVKAKFALCDQLEAQINASAHTAETLSAAILQELFDKNGGEA
jgi:type I restriction enzyme S subunit